ncbi:MAG: PAS domain-containing protein [Planctomycetes bacterium]|nr:PAS domain-containing protein [Planctomycetota bacterium]
MDPHVAAEGSLAASPSKNPSPDPVANVQPEATHRRPVPHFVVGIGASAGGLEAIEHFFDHVPEDSGVTFVVVQHLSPDFKSLMDELLARHTKLPIHRVEDGMAIQPNAIYLIPRKKNMVLSFGKLMLMDQDQKPGPNLPIDIFFQSLAHDMGDRAIGVVLSGTGSDGSRGIKEIHEAGGLVLVQEPETSGFDGMPKAAIATGLADLVLPPQAMPAKILQYTQHPVRSEIRKVRLDIQSGDELSAVFSLLRRHFGVDFSLYKPSTLGRRLERRMTLQNTESLADYVASLEADRDELDHLYRDLLVEVTQFFRDKDAFDVIKREVIPKLFEQASPDDGLRIWVPGCATGEEAYSLAILFHEFAQTHKQNIDVKIFATDVHRSSLEAASAGVYRESSVADMPREYLERYFVHKRNHFVVTQDIRKLVIFAPHNLTKDPPFTKLDLVTCRNVLIYLNPATQRKVLTLFHFGLRTGGVLFLGPSESLSDLEEEFDVIDRHWKVFRKRRDIRLHPATGLATMPLSETAMLLRNPLVNQGKGDPQLPEIYEGLLTRYVPPSLLLNEHHELVHSFGNARTYLQIPEGKATTDVLKMLDHTLRIAVSSALHQAAKANKPVVYSGVRFSLNGQDRLMKVTAVPLANKRTQSNFYQVCLEPEEAPAAVEPIQTFDAQGESAERISSLERELMYTKEHLQSTIEELETSNEELQSTNEELVASNEELQSTNEELHSVNEELYTVNAEHQRKIEELIQLTSDMDNLLASTDIGTIFLDLEMNIRKFTPAIGRLFNLLPHDVGRPLRHISNNLQMDNAVLVSLIERMHTEGKTVEQEVEAPQKRSFLVRVLPYHSQHGQVGGTVLTFIDITAVKEARQELGASQRRLDAVLDNSTSIIFVKDLDDRYSLVNRSFSFLLDGRDQAIVGKSDFEIFPFPLAKSRQELDARVREVQGVVEAEETFHLADGPRTFLTTRFPLRDEQNRIYAVAGISTDITDRKRAENEARDALARRDQFLAMLSHELRNPLSAILNATQVLEQDGAGLHLHREARDVIQRQVGQMSRLLDDLLDVTRIAQNRIRLHKSVVDLRAIANEAIASVKTTFDSAGVVLHCDVGSEAAAVLGDAARLQQMMVNLLMNAAKYTPAGGVVQFSLEPDDTQLIVRVKDTGVGIRPDMLEKIFDVFVQANETLDRSDGGIGVGLTLVRTIAEMHHGSVKAFSDGVGKGSEFVVRLPRSTESPVPPAPHSEFPKNPARVLIIEDNADSRRMLEAMLKLDGYTVDTAADGATGLDAILRLRPQFAIIDIGLPGMDGYQVARQVRASMSKDDVFLIALTGYGRPDDRRAVKEAGFDQHLVKPLKPHELTRVLQGAAEKQ